MPDNTPTSSSKVNYSLESIRDKIHVVRGVQVMLDSDLATVYGYTTSRFNEQVSNNKERFKGEEFSFFLTKEEVTNLMSKKSISSWGGRRKPPRVFTESGVYMLMTVLRGELAVEQSRILIRTFREMRHYLITNSMVFQRLDRIELKQLEADEKFKQIFEQLETPKQNKAIIFFKGQMWDATNCIEEIISKAKKSIILIDGYVDRYTLSLLTRKKAGLPVTIYTSEKNCKITEQESKSFNNQYGPLNIRFTDEFHDRFLILDEKELYHIGASIKDAGKKAFEISINDDEKLLAAILERL